ncbi:N-acetylmuramoyl-L-alanine amidase [Bacillus massiliglaciei]|uniref:N-acetylmuramoyl-L-alanine amidase n=1 Tax=Bacillus massiliglaciei TaxID=1816693 RepID=UPI000B2F355A|nr:N-acetylmuramoyl-L-alanine amidase [Bacillus massiliglaciei]
MRIVLDAGHGYSTPGKRSPNGMKEYEFNRAAANHAKSLLAKFKEIQILFTHEDTRDVPLKERTDKANASGTDLFISIHANAYGSGSWNEANGVETYVYTSQPKKAAEFARLLQNKMITATGLKDRGIKTGNFYVLKQTKCPAVLLECGFMTNRTEADLLKSDSYRQLCGKAIADAVTEFFSLSTVAASDHSKLYRVQTGAFKDKKKAEALAKELIKKGYDAIIKTD